MRVEIAPARVTTLTAPRGSVCYCRLRVGVRSAASICYVKEDFMLWTIFVILLVLWLLGMVSSYTLGGFIHVLLVVAIVIALLQLIQGRRVV
jgi:uncharacterized protein DUF5670